MERCESRLLLSAPTDADIGLAPGAGGDHGRPYAAGELLVKFRPGAAPEVVEKASRDLGGSQVDHFDNIGVRALRLGQGVSVEQAMNILNGPAWSDVVAYAEPNYTLYASDFPAQPGDPLRGNLYGLHNVGQTGGTLDADIDAPEAWAAGYTGSSSIVVGIIDTGIDYTHPDLVDNIWTNPGEVPGNGIDDDANGFVDDVHGYDFVGAGDSDPMDDNGHGSHVAGTIGARGDNGIGVVGVNWDVKLMAIKFLGSNGSGTTDDAIEAVNYAARMGVRITSNSWGGGAFSQALYDAINASGALTVAAAGNSGNSTPRYPAAFDLDNVVSVAATDHNDALASFSNYDPSWVDLAAPGVSVLSTYAGNTYRSLNGTSMATPHVSGAAALVLAANPSLSTAALKATLMNSVDPLASLAGKTVTGGRLNVARAVGAPELPVTDTTAPGQATDLAASNPTPTTITLGWTATGDDGATGTAYAYEIRYSTSPITDATWSGAAPVGGEPGPGSPGTAQAFVVTGLLSSTPYYVAVRVFDEVGNASPLSNVAAATTAPAPWTVGTVDSAGNAGDLNAHAYNPLTGRPAIAYSDATNDDLKLGEWDGSRWVFTTVDASTSSASSIDMAYDASGRPSISYGRGRLKFARRTGSSWTIQTVDTNALGSVSSLAYDPRTGNPAISYHWNNKSLKLAVWNGKAWQSQVVANAAALYSSLAYDPLTGNAAIAFCDDGNSDGALDTLKFARWTGTAWSVQVLETGGMGFGARASLAFAPDGSAAVVHTSGGSVRVLRSNGSPWAGGGWAPVETLPGFGSSVVADRTGALFVSMYQGGNLNVARRDPATGAWQAETVDRGINGGELATNVQLDPAGRPSVSYSDYNVRDLKFANRSDAPFGLTSTSGISSQAAARSPTPSQARSDSLIVAGSQGLFPHDVAGHPNRRRAGLIRD
jgi:subtilisin family serine protease